MRIPVWLGTINIVFEPSPLIGWGIAKIIKDIIMVDGKADVTQRLAAVKEYRKFTGCTIKEAIEYTNKFYPPGQRLEVPKNGN